MLARLVKGKAMRHVYRNAHMRWTLLMILFCGAFMAGCVLGAFNRIDQIEDTQADIAKALVIYADIQERGLKNGTR